MSGLTSWEPFFIPNELRAVGLVVHGEARHPNIVGGESTGERAIAARLGTVKRDGYDACVYE